MTLRTQRLVLAFCLGVLAMALSFLASLFLETAGARTIARLLLWPMEIGGWAGGKFVSVDGEGPDRRVSYAIAGYLFGFPLGARVYGAMAHFVMRKR